MFTFESELLKSRPMFCDSSHNDSYFKKPVGENTKNSCGKNRSKVLVLKSNKRPYSMGRFSDVFKIQSQKNEQLETTGININDFETPDSGNLVPQKISLDRIEKILSGKVEDNLRQSTRKREDNLPKVTEKRDLEHGLMAYGNSDRVGNKIPVAPQKKAGEQSQNLSTKLAISKMQINFLSGKVGLEFYLKNNLASSKRCSFLNTLEKPRDLMHKEDVVYKMRSRSDAKIASPDNFTDTEPEQRSMNFSHSRIDFLNADTSANLKSKDKQQLRTPSHARTTVENLKQTNTSLVSQSTFSTKKKSEHVSFVNSNLTLTPYQNDLMFLTDQGFRKNSPSAGKYKASKYFLKENARSNQNLDSQDQQIQQNQSSSTRRNVKLNLPKSSSKLHLHQSSECSSHSRKKSLTNSIGSKFLHQFKMPGTLLFERRTKLITNLTRDIR